MKGRLELNVIASTAIDQVLAGSTPRDLERGVLDFKEWKPPQRNDKDRIKRGAEDLAEAAACFSNAEGGVVIVGVADRGRGPSAFVGLPDDIDPEDLRHRIMRATSPPLLVDVEEVARAGRRVVVVTVVPDQDLHRVGGKLRERIADSCEPMRPEREARVLEDRRRFDWSAEPSGLVTDDASPRALEEARRLLIEAGDDTSLRRARLTDEDLLRECGLLSSGLRLTQAGAVLFAEPARLRDLGSSTELQYLRKSTPGGPLTRPPERSDAPTLIAIRRVLEQIEAVNETTPVTLRSGVQQQIETVPSPAIREAVVNAVSHRDYRLSQQVVVEHAPQTIVVVSPGSLVFGVTSANILTHPSKPRNATLAAALGTLRLAERAGTGADAMVRAMVRAGHAPPVFEDQDDRVRVVLTGGAPVTRVASLLAGLPEELRDDTDTALVVHHLRSRRHVDAHTLAAVIQKSDDEAAFALHRLSDDSIALLEPAAPVRGQPTRYQFRENIRAELGTLLPYHRNPRSEVERRIVAHVREYGTVSNATVRNLFQVETVRASQILRELTDRGVLARTADSPQRGPSVRYERGPRFPAKRRSG